MQKITRFARPLRQISTQLSLWLIFGGAAYAGLTKAEPFVQEKLFDFLIFGRLENPWSALCFFVWVILSLITMLAPFVAFAFAGPAILWTIDFVKYKPIVIRGQAPYWH